MRRLLPLPIALALLGLLFTAPSAISTGTVPVEIADLAANMPAAAYAAEPALPTPAGWPFDEAFPRTSGTGRQVAGAFEWSDFLYDDHGARGVPRSMPVASLAPAEGTFDYTHPDAKKNGADIFRVGIGRDAEASYWRIDWTTLKNADVPIASFGIDSAAVGTAAWPGITGLKANDIDKAITVSSRGAWLTDALTGAKTALPAPTVDMAARSFVVRVPALTLPVSGDWVVRVVSGEANAAGDGFAAVDQNHGALPGQPPVFNVGFRAHTQEPQFMNFWMEDAQAQALMLGDVSQFSATVDWDDLAAGITTPEPSPTGYLNRWYVSSITVDDGQGVVANSGGGTGDLRPNYLGPVQPYAVYVPTTYDASKPTPLTWILHSLSVMHNQYGATTPNFVLQACEERGSICATTLGRAPDGWYYDEAELDFWEVWNRLAASFNLDTERTVLSGYSMGGWATYKLGLAHPDLFAKAVVLAGPPGCGLRFNQQYGGPGGPGRCTTDGNSTPNVKNARSLPFYIAHGTNDELVPVTSVREQVDTFKALGQRYYFELFPGQDHMAYAVEDHFRRAADAMGNGPRETAPAQVSYQWSPYLDRPEWGLQATGAYWVRDPRARNAAAGSTALVEAVSTAGPQPVTAPLFTQNVDPLADPTPSYIEEQTWVHMGTKPSGSDLTVMLANVSSVVIDVLGAGFAPGQSGTISIDSDGVSTVTLRTSSGDVVLPAGSTGVGFTA